MHTDEDDFRLRKCLNLIMMLYEDEHMICDTNKLDDDLVIWDSC